VIRTQCLLLICSDENNFMIYFVPSWDLFVWKLSLPSNALNMAVFYVHRVQCPILNLFSAYTIGPQYHFNLFSCLQSPFACVLALCYVPGMKSAGGCMSD
jgi:hypothetical protein